MKKQHDVHLIKYYEIICSQEPGFLQNHCPDISVFYLQIVLTPPSTNHDAPGGLFCNQQICKIQNSSIRLAQIKFCTNTSEEEKSFFFFPNLYIPSIYFLQDSKTVSVANFVDY